MKKFLISLLLVVFVLSVVRLAYGFEKFDEEIIQNDTEAEICSEHEEGYVNYVVNLSTMKYHSPSCIYADIKDEQNERIMKNEDFLIEHGYTACKKCIPWAR